MSVFLCVGCPTEPERDPIGCSDPAGQIDLSEIEKTCRERCGAEACWDTDASAEDCLESCASIATEPAGAAWLIWQECRFANECDAVFEAENCTLFAEGYATCGCENLSVRIIDMVADCASLDLADCSVLDVECAATETGGCPGRNECLAKHVEVCLERVGDSDCGAAWVAYSRCLVNGECEPGLCEEEQIAWEQCPGGPGTSEAIETTCRAKCDEWRCRETATNETTCLSDCKRTGEESCGALWLKWQGCRTANSCDGVFDVTNCEDFQKEYDECMK